MGGVLVWLFLAMLTWGLGEGMFYSFQPLYLQQLGADPLAIGSILGLVGLVIMLSFLPAGYLSDRIGRQPLLRISWITGLISTIIMAFAPDMPIFIIGMMLYGLTSFVTVPMYSYVAAAHGRLSVARALTLNSAFFNFGSILGPIIGGLIGERMGLQANFRYAVLVLILSSGLIFLLRPQPIEDSSDREVFSDFRDLFKGRYRLYLILVFFIMIGLYLPWPLMQNFLLNERGIGLRQIGQLIAVRSIGAVILNLLLGHFNARLGLLIAQICSAFFTLAIALGTGMPFYAAGYFLMGSMIAGRGLIMAQGRALVQATNMGLAFGMLETVMAIALVAAPPLAGLIYNQNPISIYFISLGLICAGLVANLLFSPLRQQDMKSFDEREKTRWIQS